MSSDEPEFNDNIEEQAPRNDDQYDVDQIDTGALGSRSIPVTKL
jgi:hypothetical protein